MKVTSWKALLSTAILGGGSLIYSLIRFDFFWILLSLYILWQGIFASFSPKEFAKVQQQSEEQNRLYRKLFGRFAPVVIAVPYCGVPICAVLFWVFPQVQLLRILLFVLLLFLFPSVIFVKPFASKSKLHGKESDMQD